MKSEKEGSGTHVAETAPPLFFFSPAVLCNSSLKISGKRRRRSINKHKGWRGEKEGGWRGKCTESRKLMQNRLKKKVRAGQSGRGSVVLSV